jgi:hypothetical protein
MKTIEYFQVEEHYDKSSKTLARFENEADAQAFADKDTIYRVVVKSSMTIFESIEDYEFNNDKELRKRAISKLSREELRVLGITYMDK